MDALAYVLTDERGIVRELGGALAEFGLSALRPGDDVTCRIDALHGLLPLLEQGSDRLPRVQLQGGRFTDIHLGRSAEGAFVVFRDVTPAAELERHYQQQGNELALLLRTLGLAVFEAHAGDRFTQVGLSPTWLRALRGDGDGDLLERFPFLESFLDEARQAWGGGTRASSGIWVEEDDEGREWYLEASALGMDDGRSLLVLQTQAERYEERRHVLQSARIKSLDFDRLRKEIDKKEVLLHCIIHDLKGPLSSMVGTMALVQGRELAAAQIRELLTVGLEQARHQEAMIKSILDTFSSEVAALQSFETSAEQAPSLLECVTEARETYAPAYEQNQVALEVDEPGLGQARKVVGEHSRLVRVLCNLLENALRHSPKGGAVTIRVDVSAAPDQGFRVSVDDRGPGVPEGLRDGLFQKFSQGKKGGGAAGLGLYFCSSTIRMWGGEIGYETAPGGGSSFWFALPEAL